VPHSNRGILDMAAAKELRPLTLPQTLALMNDDFTQDQAGYFAKRIIQQARNDATRQATIALEQALAGRPLLHSLTNSLRYLCGNA
jgi:hypothetical protein